MTFLTARVGRPCGGDWEYLTYALEDDELRHYPARASRSPAGHWSASRDRATQARFRAALIQRAGLRCEWMQGPYRCVTSTGLQAHHREPGNDDPSTGLLLCKRHHREIDPYAR